MSSAANVTPPQTTNNSSAVSSLSEATFSGGGGGGGGGPVTGGGPTLDDRRDFHVTRKAMEDMGMSPEEVGDVFRIVAAILKLGNINFVPTTHMDGTEGCALSNEYGKKRKAPFKYYKDSTFLFNTFLFTNFFFYLTCTGKIYFFIQSSTMSAKFFTAILSCSKLVC